LCLCVIISFLYKSKVYVTLIIGYFSFFINITLLFFKMKNKINEQWGILITFFICIKYIFLVSSYYKLNQYHLNLRFFSLSNKTLFIHKSIIEKKKRYLKINILYKCMYSFVFFLLLTNNNNNTHHFNLK
jgi:hypothetical protein